MLQWIISFLSTPILGAIVQAYQAHLTAGNTAENIEATLAARELAVEQRALELNQQIILSEEGRWWTALPRAIVTYSFAIYVFKAVVIDKVLGLGSTSALGGDIEVWGGWVMAVWFSGRTFEKIARILKRSG